MPLYLGLHNLHIIDKNWSHFSSSDLRTDGTRGDPI